MVGGLMRAQSFGHALMRHSLMLSAVVLMQSCADVGIQYIEPEPPPTYDNLLRLKGEHCVQPDDTLDFPVKVLLVMDQSASLQCTDSRRRRIDAFNDSLNMLLRQRAVSVALLGFSSWARTWPDPTAEDQNATEYFTTDRSVFDDAVNDGGGSATDYQGALAKVLQHIEADILATPRGERARTRYVVTFLSDGSPEPRCNAGCEDGESFGMPGGAFFEGTCGNGEDDDGDGDVDGQDVDCQDPQLLDPPFSACNFRGRADLPEDVGEDEYIDFSGVCPDYNQKSQLLQRVRDIMELQDIYNVGGINVNTVLIFSPMDVTDAACGGDAAMFGYDRVEASDIMSAMAREGRGAFRDIDVSTASTDFLQFDFRPLDGPQWLSGLVVDNQHARPGIDGVEPDTDLDGVSDPIEDQGVTDANEPDSDVGGGDGYSDGLETRLSESGFDPESASDPPVPCEDMEDTDGDGLRNCEEEVLGTSIRLADSDGDQISDWLEVISGTDPAVADAEQDLDFDGVLNAEEIRAGTDPSRPDAERYRREAMSYDVRDLGRREVDGEDRRCYEFDVRDIQLVETPVVGARGLNRILVYSHEQPSMLSGSDGLTYVACFEAYYNGETSKVPESGVIDASQTGWTSLLTDLQTGVDALASCDWLSEGFDRNQLNTVIRDCMTDDVVLGRFNYDRDQQRQLIEQYIAMNRGMRMPLEAWQLFRPIENFNPDRDCVRPWEMNRLLELFDQLMNACACQEPDSDDEDAVELSACCM